MSNTSIRSQVLPSINISNYSLNLVVFLQIFGYWGMRSLIVTFMITKLYYGDQYTITTYLMYQLLIESGSIIGGYIADKLLGFRTTIIMGMICITIGQLLMIFVNNDYIYLFYPALSFIVMGLILFRTNTVALIGSFYKNNPKNSYKGYTIYYIVANVAISCAIIVSTIVVDYWGWQNAFILLTLCFLLGAFSFILFSKRLCANIDKPQVQYQNKTLTIVSILTLILPISYVLWQSMLFSILLPIFVVGTIVFFVLLIIRNKIKQARSNLAIILFLVLILAIFKCIIDLEQSALITFIESLGLFNSNILGYNVSKTMILVINPFVIAVFGTFLYLLFIKRNVSPSSITKLFTAFMLVSISFIILYIFCHLYRISGVISISYIILVYVLLALSELLIVPTVQSLSYNLAPQSYKGQIMGFIVFEIYVSAKAVSGFINNLLPSSGTTVMNQEILTIYAETFMYIFIFCIFVSFVLFMITKLIPRSTSV